VWSVKSWRPQQVCNKSTTRLRVRRTEPPSEPSTPPAPPPPRPTAPSEASGAANRTSLSNNFPLVSTTHRRKAPGTWHGGSKKPESSQSICCSLAVGMRQKQKRYHSQHTQFYFFNLISPCLWCWQNWFTLSRHGELKTRVMNFYQCLCFEYF
jgi:hypothetical protein